MNRKCTKLLVTMALLALFVVQSITTTMAATATDSSTTRAAQAVAAWNPAVTKLSGDMEVATLLQFAELNWDALPKGFNELLFTERVSNSPDDQYDDATTKRLLAACTDAAVRFIQDTGTTILMHDDRQVAEAFALWWAKHSQSAGLEDLGLSPAISSSQAITDRQATILRIMGVYALAVDGHFLSPFAASNTPPESTAAVLVYDRASGQHYTYNCLDSNVKLYDNPYDLFANTGILLSGSYREEPNWLAIHVDIDSSGSLNEVHPGSEAITFWLRGHFGDELVVYPDRDYFSPGEIKALSFNSHAEDPLLRDYVWDATQLVTSNRSQFEPDRLVTRAEFVAMAVYYVRRPLFQAFENRFSDLPDGNRYTFHVNYAAEMGWIPDAELFRPDDPMTLEEALPLRTKIAEWCVAQGYEPRGINRTYQSLSPHFTRAEACRFIVELMSVEGFPR